MSEQAIQEVMRLVGTAIAKGIAGDIESVGPGIDAVEAAVCKLADRLAEQAEGESILLGCGPITCRNGRQHERIEGCIYCELDAVRKLAPVAPVASKEVEAMCDKLRRIVDGYEQSPIGICNTAEEAIAMLRKLATAQTSASPIPSKSPDCLP